MKPEPSKIRHSPGTVTASRDRGAQPFWGQNGKKGVIKSPNCCDLVRGRLGRTVLPGAGGARPGIDLALQGSSRSPAAASRHTFSSSESSATLYTKALDRAAGGYHCARGQHGPQERAPRWVEDMRGRPVRLGVILGSFRYDFSKVSEGRTRSFMIGSRGSTRGRFRCAHEAAASGYEGARTAWGMGFLRR
jgi:hypothetical protein